MLADEVCPKTPPGLESRGKEWSPMQASTTGSGYESSSPPKKVFDDMKEVILRQVHDELDWKIAGAVDALRQNFQKAMQCMHEQYVTSSLNLQGALDVQMQHQQKLAEDIANIRKHLDNSTPRLRSSSAGLLSRGGSSLRLAPYLSNALARVDEQDVDSLKTEPCVQLLAECESYTDSAKEAGALEHERFRTPLVSPKQEASLSSHSQILDSSSQGTTVSEVVVSQEVDAKPIGFVQLDAVPSRCVNLTIRRADSIPLGLDLSGHGRERFLTVRAINPGGAAEAWNRQCENGLREIRKGDRIVAINEERDANTMRREYNKKHLLKISLLRDPIVGMRADAAEFCPSQGCHELVDPDGEMCPS